MYGTGRVKTSSPTSLYKKTLQADRDFSDHLLPHPHLRAYFSIFYKEKKCFSKKNNMIVTFQSKPEWKDIFGVSICRSNLFFCGSSEKNLSPLVPGVHKKVVHT